MIAGGQSCFQKAAAAAQNSRLGNGGSAHRMAGQGRPTDHGHHALMRISAFKSVGGYDETFSHNEDAELDVRLKRAGCRIWLSGGEPVVYYPRRSARALVRQYWNYGRGRARTLLKHRIRPKLRQSLPLAVAPALALAAFFPVSQLFAVPAFIWAGLCLGYGGVLGLKECQLCASQSGVAAMIMHFAWSAGFLAMLVQEGTRKSGASQAGQPPLPASAALPGNERAIR
jgi:succinoglycan biosynthesis protein ExoA